MEPLPGADPGGTPIPRASGRRSEGHELGAQDSNLENLGPNRWTGGEYARRDSNPQPHGPQPCPSTCLRHERAEPPPGVEPGHPPYEGEAAAVRGGEAAPRGFEPRLMASEATVLPLDERAPSRGDAVERASRFLLRKPRLPDSPSLRCAPPETRTPFPRLRVGCITCHACGALRAVPGTRTPMICVEGKRLSR